MAHFIRERLTVAQAQGLAVLWLRVLPAQELALAAYRNLAQVLALPLADLVVLSRRLVHYLLALQASG